MNDYKNFVIPTIETRDGNRVTYNDIFSLLHKDRIIFIGTPIIDLVASIVVAQLLHLESEDKNKPISLYINSPGGDITAGLAIRDTMRFVRPEIHTICIGQCASMAAILLAEGAKGKRYATSSSRILIHQPWSNGGGGQQSDILLQAKEITRMRDQLELMLANSTGQPLEKVHNDCDRDYVMSAEEARIYGIVDKVFDKREDTHKV
jgi:ATP-dependent Clp protease, protease subunit